MKQIIACMAISMLLINAQAQSQFGSANDYLTFISKNIEKVDADMWDYNSAIAHGKRARKIENRRKDLIKSIEEAQGNICETKAFKGGKSFKDSVCVFLSTNLNMLNKDYAKIVDMEEISENSYTDMEAYMSALEEADEKLTDVGKSYERAYKQFADEHNIKLIESSSKLSEKAKKANVIFKRNHKLYLIFFHAFKEEALMLEGINKTNLKLTKMHRDTLIEVAKDGIARLQKLKPVNGETDVKTALKDLLMFYQTEAGAQSETAIDYVKKSKTLKKLKKDLDEGDKEQTKAYNEAVVDYNNELKKFNAWSEKNNQLRKQKQDKWDAELKDFLDTNVPK